MNLRGVRRLVGAAAFGIASHAAAADLEWLDDSDAVHEFVDGVMATQIAAGQVVGATISIVRGNNFVLAQGYGLADRAASVPVDGTDTLFRIGSLSKVFVWVAVMQQVVAGRLDLNADVNTYLTEFQIAETFPQPITLAHLMTHTAGFEDSRVGLFARGALTVGDFHANLISMMPQRVMMPGHYAAYSNYGAALAAHLVEIASGESWDDYVDRHILKPSLMLNTTTRQPVSRTLAEHVANGYWRKSGDDVKAPFEFLALPPAGSVSSSGADMGRFMMELLAHGNTTVLTAAARSQLFAAGHQRDSRLNRMLFGLYERNSHGQVLVGHDGDILAFHSVMLLCPALNLGVFASYNNDRSTAPREVLIEAFLDRLFGRPNVQLKADQAINAERYAGYYSSLRAPHSGHDRILWLLGTTLVSVDTENRLLLWNANGQRRFVKVDSDLFESEDGRERVAFAGDGSLATHLFIDSEPMTDNARVALRDHPLLHWGILIVVLLLCVAAWLLWPLSWWRHLARVSLAGETGATVLAIFNTLLIVGFCAVVATTLADPREVAFGLSEDFDNALWIPIALAPLLLVQLVYTYRAWLGGLWWVSRRIHYTLLTLAGIGFVVWAFYWHLTAVIVDF